MRAFVLKSEYADVTGGSVALPPNGETIDIGRRLRDGVIVVHSEVEGNALDKFHAMREVTGGKELEDVLARWDANGPRGSSDDGADSTDVVDDPDPNDGADGTPTRAELVDRAKELGISTSGNKGELAARIAEFEGNADDNGGDR